MSPTSSHKILERRVIKTRQAIRQALFRLVGSQDWHELSVSALCREAGVARSTFYLHYASPAAVLDEAIAEIVAAFRQNESSAMPVLEWLVDHVAANRTVFQRTANGAQAGFVIDRFKSGIMTAFATEQGLGSDRPSQIRTAMIIGGAFQALGSCRTAATQGRNPQTRAYCA
jgi:AcrR family transcriptional regulator